MTDVDIDRTDAGGPAATHIVDLLAVDRPEAFVQLPPMDAAGLVGPAPTELLALVHTDDARGLAIGLWDCSAYETPFEPYPEHEFMYLLEGSVTIAEPGGRSTTVVAGQSFVIPAGLVCAWKQTGRVRKVFVTLAPSAGDVTAPADLAVVVVDPATPLTADAGPRPEDVVGDAPTVASTVLFRDEPTGFEVGLWSSTGYERRPVPSALTEVMVPLTGRATLGDGAGGGVELQPGGAVLVPQAVVTQWSATQTVLKIYCVV